MVDTWRWPKLLYSALLTSRVLMPMRAALSLSMVTNISTPFSAWSVSTSTSAGWRFMASASFDAHSFRSWLLSLFSVYW